MMISSVNLIVALLLKHDSSKTNLTLPLALANLGFIFYQNRFGGLHLRLILRIERRHGWDLLLKRNLVSCGKGGLNVKMN